MGIVRGITGGTSRASVSNIVARDAVPLQANTVPVYGSARNLRTATASPNRRMPQSLFANGEPGFVIDANDLSSMYEDMQGTIPTGLERPVGLMLDRKFGLPLGEQIVPNNFFDTADGWILGTGWSISGGQAIKTAGTASSLSIPVNVVPGKTYRIIFDYTKTAGTMSVRFTGGIASSEPFPIQTGDVNSATWVSVQTANYGNTLLSFTSNSASAFTIDNVYVREISGNDLLTTVATLRPLLSARVNLLTATDALATQSVTVIAASYRLSFEGSGSIALSGTGSGTFTAGSHLITTTAGTLTLTVAGNVSNADLRHSNDSLSCPAYQRVVTSTDYDVNGFPYYLAFDGVDDMLFTGPTGYATYNYPIFSSSKAIAMIASTRNTSATVDGSLVHLSQQNNNNIFWLLTNGIIINAGEFSSNNYADVRFPLSRVSSYVITGYAERNSNALALRVNKRKVATSFAPYVLTDGVFQNNAVQVGARNGLDARLNGRIYRLIVRGAATTEQDLALAEDWCNEYAQVNI